MAKLGAPHKGIVYFNGEMPVLIDVNGKGDFLIPTVFSLWSSPNLLPAFEVSASHLCIPIHPGFSKSDFLILESTGVMKKWFKGLFCFKINSVTC